MSISVNFYQTGKKVNSTAIPQQIVGDFGVSAELKNPTNLFTPTLILSADLFTDGNDNITNPMKFVYAYISDFERYYFIRSWSWVSGLWECSLEVDVLASFKTAIGNTTAYVLRSYSNCNNSVVDTKYSAKSTVKTLSSSYSSIWGTDLAANTVTGGFYVLGIVNNDSGAIGATSYYAVNGAGMRKFMSELYASPSWLNITDTSISTDLQKMLINPIQYINTCMWIPYGLPNANTLTQITTIPVGWWTVTINSNDPFYKLTGSSLKMAITPAAFDVNVHPQATNDSKLDWLKNSPYSAYQLQFYPFGVFPIDSSKLVGYNKLNCHIAIDLITGMGTLTVTRGINNVDYAADILFSGSAQVGVPITMAQMSVDMTRLNNGTTWLASAGMALAQNGVIEGAQEYVSGYLSQATGNISSIWHDGNRSLWQKIKDTATYPFSAQHHDLGETYSGGSGGSLLGTVQKIGADIGNAVLASSGVCTTTGSTGTLAQYTLEQILTLFYFEIVDTDPTHYGYPLCQSKKINTLSGFVLCANGGDFAGNCTETERQAVVSMMQAGFYYE